MSADATVDGDGGLSVIPWRSPILYVILLSSLVGVMGVSLISPVLPDLRGVFGISDSQAGLVITAYTVPGIFLTPFVGLAADRFGRRSVLVPLLVGFGVAGAGVGFAGTFTEVLALRFLQGVGASGLVTLAITLIGDLYESSRRDAIIGFNGSTIGTGAAIYPLIGGGLATIRWNAPFLFFGVAVLVGLFALAVMDEPDTDDRTDVRTYLTQLREVALLPQALAIFLAIFAVFFIFYGVVLTSVPLLMSDEFGLAADRIGVLLGLVSIASAAAASQYGRFSRLQSPSELVALGFTANGVGVLGVWLSPSLPFIGASLLVFGFGLGVAVPSLDTAVVTSVSTRLRAGMMSMRTSMLRLGQTLGPVAFTFTAETAFETSLAGYRFLLLGVGSAVVVVGTLAYLFVRGRF